MPFDFKKEYKEFYMPKGKPEIVTVPKMNFIAVKGSGNPNDEDGYFWIAKTFLAQNRQQKATSAFKQAYKLALKNKFDELGIEIPFPQRVVTTK